MLFPLLYTLATAAFGGAVLRLLLRQELKVGLEIALALLLLLLFEPLCYKVMPGYLGFCLFSLACLLAYWKLPMSGLLPVQEKAVLITGCDSGFGHALAKYLDELGFTVFAGVLFLNGPGAQDLKRYGSDRLTVLQMDVTNSQQISQSFESVKAQVEDKGSVPFMRNVSYNASKAALSMFFNTLRYELAIWGVKVVIIQPSGFKTGIFGTIDQWNQQHTKIFQQLSPEVRKDYGESYLNLLKEQYTAFQSHVSDTLQPVLKDILTALLANNPRRLYTPGLGAFLIPFLYHNFPTFISDFLIFQLFDLIQNVPDGAKQKGVYQ
ncbi:17-beta-hydroxysteroid dehydrogenase type 2-like isoform X2 [Mobula hypostoma]|uniref:17-beta-hydroxysteroid dehydrogenase type 2-like isoform X2 n=1 Tax=Mobula hypostoma TaxID=723540 RepID=UPI002FC33CE7